jgi:3-oxoacyl-[acyl-carrier protein] reductase
VQDGYYCPSIEGLRRGAGGEQVVGIFDGRIVVVTGAARGLGRDYANFFASDGANVVLSDVNTAESATRAASAHGPRCIDVACDVTDRVSVERLMHTTANEFGRLDILINNAGLWRGMNEAGLLHCPDDVWNAAWAVNVTGSLRCYQAAVPFMRANGFGRVVNISSMAAKNGGNPYGLTKNAVEHMTAGMAREVGNLGITVNCIAPGICAFEGAKSALASADALVASLAVPRMGTSRDLYAAMAYLCTPAAEWVTGQVVNVDGGADVS